MERRPPRAVDGPPGAADGTAPHPAAEPCSLDQALAQLRGELARHTPPATLEAALLARYAALQGGGGAPDHPPFADRRTGTAPQPGPQHGSVRRRRLGWSARSAAWSGATAGLAVLGLTALLTFGPTVPHGSPAAAGEFVAVAGPGQWSLAQLDSGAAVAGVGQAWIVPAELPQAQLALFGLPFDTAHADDLVRAEMLVSAQGDVLAVRLLGSTPMMN
jgi:hypothetical protein